MKQRIDLGQWQALTPAAQGRWQVWRLAHDYPPVEVHRRTHWEDEGRLWHAPTIGGLIEYLAERGRLDHDRWGLVVLPCEHGALESLCDALWVRVAPLLER